MDRLNEPISLSPVHEHFVARQVELGRFSSATKAVERGVELLAEEEGLLGLDKAAVRRKLDRAARQIARGDVMDGDTFFAELRREDIQGEKKPRKRAVRRSKR